MWFKNLHIYRLHAEEVIALTDLEEALAEQAYRPLGGSEATRLGWRTPGGRNSARYAHEVQGHRLLSALRQERILPGAVVREEVEERIADREAAEGRFVPRQERQAIKEQVYEEFLPRAFVHTQRIDLWWDTRGGLIGINASSRKRAEEALDLLRQTLGSLKVTPLATQILPIRAMTAWLSDPRQRPEGLVLGDQVELKAKDEGVVRARQMDMDSDEIKQLLESGRQVTKLAMEIESRLAWTLHDDLSIKSLRFADALMDEAAQADDGDDAILRMETDFALMAQALSELVGNMVKWMGGEASAKTDSAPSDPGSGGWLPDSEDDPMYREAKSYVIESQKASISAVQRRLKLGYNRAARYLEAMEAEGIVSSIDGKGLRRVISGATHA